MQKFVNYKSSLIMKFIILSLIPFANASECESENSYECSPLQSRPAICNDIDLKLCQKEEYAVRRLNCLKRLKEKLDLCYSTMEEKGFERKKNIRDYHREKRNEIKLKANAHVERNYKQEVHSAINQHEIDMFEEEHVKTRLSELHSYVRRVIFFRLNKISNDLDQILNQLLNSKVSEEEKKNLLTKLNIHTNFLNSMPENYQLRKKMVLDKLQNEISHKNYKESLPLFAEVDKVLHEIDPIAEQTQKLKLKLNLSLLTKAEPNSKTSLQLLLDRIKRQKDLVAQGRKSKSYDKVIQSTLRMCRHLGEKAYQKCKAASL
ncbi:MAG: hypothetical protein CL674_15725 [Bdellovibrionaceae bacterium]|nr:hypothetical protein [Pseudobdellovibrionaceae bacterium]|tara:strand:- start:16103 stop:17059 length:957 start_codon:yes stop_codon:yes gene_type:complete